MNIKKILPVLMLVIILTLAIGITTAGAAEAGGQSSEKTIKAGKTYDVSLGNCGMYFIAPEDGELKLGRQDRTTLPLKFMKDSCTVEYENDAGATLHDFDGILISYFVLDKVQYDKWMDGELAFYVHDGSWKACDAVWMPGGAFGRLTCWTGAFDDFGIVDLHKKATDDDDDKKVAKLPSGSRVAAGQTIDEYDGNCGVYVANIPSAGYVDMGHSNENYNLKFTKDPCDFTFVDAKENDISTKGSLVIGYVNLNSAQLEAWNEGELGFFANYGSGWTELNPMLLSERGKPRLCATMSGPGMFGLVDLSVPEVDEDE